MTDSDKWAYVTALAIVALVVVSVFAITRPTAILGGTGATAQRTITINGVGTVESYSYCQDSAYNLQQYSTILPGAN
jgi:cation transport ATPase